jgi:hypothetical protein
MRTRIARRSGRDYPRCMAEISEERRLRDLRYLKAELEREERQKSQVIPDGAERDFRDLLDFACTTTATPVSPREPKDKPETSSAPKAE